jgi:hypothetical protein
MTPSWTSLYLPCDVALKESLTALGYSLYNPFTPLPGKAYSHSVRLFVAPMVDGWTRVIGEPDMQQLPILSQQCLCLYVTLAGKDAQVEVYTDGKQAEPRTTLVPYLRTGRIAGDLDKALHHAAVSIVEPAMPIAGLSDEMQAMAEKVDQQQAQKMFERLSGKLMGKVSPGGSAADEARRMIAETLDWNSVGGHRIRALMACLTIPDNWRDPDFVTLRDAYQLHERKQRNPNARLYPGDAEAMEQVPNALDYEPVYGGR